MPRKARQTTGKHRQPTYIRSWRKVRGLSLAKLSERLLVMEELDISEAQLSRIETGKQPYSQDLLEALARVLQCEVNDLIIRDPERKNAVWSIWDNASPVEREQAEAFIETIRRRTGTDDR